MSVSDLFDHPAVRLEFPFSVVCQPVCGFIVKVKTLDLEICEGAL